MKLRPTEKEGNQMRSYLITAVVFLGIANYCGAQQSATRPEAIGGKWYSQGECLQIARWASQKPRNVKELTGIDLGNLWYTLDNCMFLYFSDATTLRKPPSPDQLNLDIALDWSIHEYISRLEGAILRLPESEKSKVLEDLKKVQSPVEGPALWHNGSQ
jgi:hypothetical protein